MKDELITHSGYSHSELIGNKTNIFKSGYTSASEYKLLWNTLLDGQTWRGLFKNLTKNKTTHWLTTAITPIFNDKNEITHYISVETNIDEKVKMEEAFLAQEDIMLIQARHAAMGEMITMIAHQWRQPLSVISTASTGIKMQKELGIVSEHEEIEALEIINNSAQYLSETINDFKNFFKKDKILEKVDAKEIIGRIQKLNLKILNTQNIQFIIKDNSSTNIYTYTNELLQVLINLINNAKDILIEKKELIQIPKIVIDISNGDNGLVIQISDNGGGVPVEIIGKIFEPYFTTKGPTSGTGLGLYITKTIIDKHLKVTIYVENNKEGALFTINIPDLK